MTITADASLAPLTQAVDPESMAVAQATVRTRVSVPLSFLGSFSLFNLRFTRS